MTLDELKAKYADREVISCGKEYMETIVEDCYFRGQVEAVTCFTKLIDGIELVRKDLRNQIQKRMEEVHPI